MFESELLERLSRVHPAVPVVVFLPAIVALLVVGLDRVGIAVLGWALAGYALWTLFEYWMHRVVFHFEPQRGLGAKLHWIIHGVHHDHPNDPMRLVMPPSVSVPLALIVYAGFAATLGSHHAPGFGGGFLAGYLSYDMTHYLLHHRPPKRRWARRLREAHMRHHFQDDTRGFGVSAPYWDRVFGTAPPDVRRRTPLG